DLAGDARVLLAELGGGAENFGEIDGGDADAGALEDLLGVADGVERARTGAADAADDAADGEEVCEVLAERGVERMDDMLRRERVGDARLAEVVADGD